jgi:uncharacterized membrane protein YvbJ
MSVEVTCKNCGNETFTVSSDNNYELPECSYCKKHNTRFSYYDIIPFVIVLVICVALYYCSTYFK